MSNKHLIFRLIVLVLLGFSTFESKVVKTNGILDKIF
jgi:hypothetical protein